MNKFKAFLARKNIAFLRQALLYRRHGSYGAGSLLHPAGGDHPQHPGTQLHIGFLTESIVTIGKGEGPWLTTIGSLCSAMVGPGMAVAIGRALEARRWCCSP